MWFWARIVLSASCPRSLSSQDPRVPRWARFLAALPAARLSSLVADRSCRAAGDDGLGELDFGTMTTLTLGNEEPGPVLGIPVTLRQALGA